MCTDACAHTMMQWSHAHDLDYDHDFSSSGWPPMDHIVKIYEAGIKRTCSLRHSTSTQWGTHIAMQAFCTPSLRCPVKSSITVHARDHLQSETPHPTMICPKAHARTPSGRKNMMNRLCEGPPNWSHHENHIAPSCPLCLTGAPIPNTHRERHC